MSSSEIDLADEVERAWTGFRGRLADRLAAMQDDEILLVEVETSVDEDDLAGCAPYLQFVAWGGDLVRAEASSNSYLDERYELTDQDEELLVDRGWLAPTHGPEDEADSGSVNFHIDLERRQADLAATMAVAALRDTFGCAHPIFLEADGLEVDPDITPPATSSDVVGDLEDSSADDDDEPIVEFPTDLAELREAVDRAVAQMFDKPLHHDADDDIAIRSGSTPLWVRVVADAPVVDVFSHVVTDIGNAERAASEVAILNRSHPFARFFVRDDVIVMKYRLFALPFMPKQLRLVLALLLEDIDDLAGDLASRVEGRRFFEEDPQPSVVPSRPEPDSVEGFTPSAVNHSALVGLLELLYDGPVRPASVAVLFENDRHAIIHELVRLRTGGADPGEHDLDLVLDQLRAALRFVAEVDAAPAPPKRLPPKPRTRQLSLIPEPQASLDLDEPS